MKYFLISVCAPIFLALCLSWPTFATTKIAYVDVPPYAYQDSHKRAKGLLIEKLRKIMYSVEVDAEFILLPHRRLIEHIKQGKVDLWAGQDNSQVNNELSLVSKTPLFLMELEAYWKTGTKKIGSFEELYNKNVIMVSSYSYGGNYSKLAKENKSVTFVINHEEGFDKLLSGNNQYFLGYKGISQGVIEKFKISDFQKSSLAKYTLYLKLSKAYPDAHEMMKKIDTFLESQDTLQNR